MRCPEKFDWGQDGSKWKVWKDDYEGWMVAEPYNMETYYYGLPCFEAVEELFDIERQRHDFEQQWGLVC